jgi:hypothetical protein
MVTDAEVEAAAEALARYGMDDDTLASVGDKSLLSIMTEDNRAAYLAKVRAGLTAAAAVRESIEKFSADSASAHP